MRLLAGLLILLTAVASQPAWVVLGAFWVNREDLARSVCVQKDAVRNCCRASCYLKSQLQDSEESDPQAATTTGRITLPEAQEQLPPQLLPLHLELIQKSSNLFPEPSNQRPSGQGGPQPPTPPPEKLQAA